MRVPIVVLSLVLSAGTAMQAQTPPIQIERNVVVGGMTSDRFTWRDANNQPRVAVLAHNTGQVGPGGTRGGELREFRYEVPAGTRIVAASSSSASGFGYVVAHPDGAEACMGGFDTSLWGHLVPGSLTRVFEGKHHVILRFTQNYPRYCATDGVPAAAIDIPVTIDWIFSTGRDHPLWAVTWDMSAIPANRLMDDSRGPYGELLFDGAATEAAHSAIAGVAWGDRYKFFSTANPVTLSSAWTWNTQNTIPWVKLWTTGVDATMGLVQTQTIAQQDAGGYWGVDRWNTTSGAGNGCTVATGGVDHLMPCTFNWPYQSINYSFANANTATNNTRLAWGTNFGFLGQTSYFVHGSAYYGGPLPNASAYGHPRKSYSVYVVLGTHSSDPVAAQVTQIETIQNLILTASKGSVVTSGPAGVSRPDAMTYAPAGYNHVYDALAFSATANQVDANISVPSGTLRKPLIIVSNYTGGDGALVKFNGTTLVADVDYYASTRTGELWITLNRNLTGATNRLEVSAPQAATLTPSGDVAGRGDFNGDGRADILLRDAGGNLGVWFMNGTAITGGGLVGNPGGSYTVAGIADFNGDSRADIILRDGAGDIGMWLMNGTAITAGALVGSPGGSYTVAGVGDFGGDGKADILLRDASGTLGLWQMNGATIVTGALIGSPGAYTVAGVGDFSGDSRADILLRDAGGSLGVWIMNGSSITGGGLAGAPGGTYSVAAVGDFSGDGRADILLRDGSGNLGMWLMNGASIASGAFVGSPGAYTVAAARDYNGDARTDILLRDATGVLGMWIMNGPAIVSGGAVGSPGAGYTIY